MSAGSRLVACESNATRVPSADGSLIPRHGDEDASRRPSRQGSSPRSSSRQCTRSLGAAIHPSQDGRRRSKAPVHVLAPVANTSPTIRDPGHAAESETDRSDVRGANRSVADGEREGASKRTTHKQSRRPRDCRARTAYGS